MLFLNLNFFLLIWKKAISVPIPNSGEDPSLTRSYRPMSLLPVISKLKEQIFLTHRQHFLSDIPEQFGFMPRSLHC